MTLLERWDQYDFRGINIKPDEIRRAIAIAQAVEEYSSAVEVHAPWIMRRADELLKEKT